MENIFRVGNDGLVDEFYFIGLTKDITYAIYANTSGHQPILVTVDDKSVYVPGQALFNTKNDATEHALNSAKHLIELLNKKG